MPLADLEYQTADTIPEGLPEGKCIHTPIEAVQGKAWGPHKYRGPKRPPFVRRAHTYRFTAFALDTVLNLDPASGKRELMRAIQGHIIEQAELFGVYDPRSSACDN